VDGGESLSIGTSGVYLWLIEKAAIEDMLTDDLTILTRNTHKAAGSPELLYSASETAE
jgi:hypothetical protein